MKHKLVRVVFGSVVSLSLLAGGSAALALSEVAGELNARTNRPPVSLDQSILTKENAAVFITLAATDADGDVLTYAIVSPPSHGKLTLVYADTHVFSYKPAKKYTGADSFTFKASDYEADSNIATVNIMVRENVKPKLSAVSVASNNPNPALAKPGDVIAIQFTASEPIQTPTVTVNNNIAVVSGSSELTWTALYTIAPEDKNGYLRFRIEFTDLADNIGSPVNKTTDRSSVRFDGINPQPYVRVSQQIISPRGSAGIKDSTLISARISEPSKVVIDVIDNTGAPVKNLYVSNDYIKSTEQYEWNGTDAAGAFVPDGTYRVKAAVSDVAGNTAANSAAVITVDNTPPIITVAPYTLAQTNQNITVTAATNEGKLNKSSHTFTKNGAFTFVATDAAGNVTTETVTITNIKK